jgi:hypothetical protein
MARRQVMIGKCKLRELTSSLGLGHNDLKTTLRYLHVTNRDMLQIISPLDNLKLE